MTEAKVERRVALLHEVARLRRDLERFLMMGQGLVALTEVIGSVRRGSQGADQPRQVATYPHVVGLFQRAPQGFCQLSILVTESTQTPGRQRARGAMVRSPGS